MLHIKKYTSIHEIDQWHWDSLLTGDDIFHRHGFIRVVEDSKVENADLFYMLIYDNEELVASTVFSAFKVSLDLFVSNSSFVEALKKVFPNLFVIRLLVCGLPASFGQLNLKIADKKYAKEVSVLVAKEMELLAKKIGISLMTVKEFREHEARQFDYFGQQGFFLANSIPYMNFEIRWNSFDAYLSSLRHSYRRKILLSLKKIGQTRPVIVDASDDNVSKVKTGFVLAETGEDFSQEFYEKYLAVMERTPTKLETLNLAFFKYLFQQKKNYKLLNLVVDGAVISSAVLIFEGDALTFMLVARAYEKDEYNSYFNLVYAIIALGIEGGCKKIKMGQTAYWVKQCVGAVPETEMIWFASRRPLVHWILKVLRNVIFPELKLKPVHVFKEEENVNERMLAETMS